MPTDAQRHAVSTPPDERDHARPRALAVDGTGTRLFVALSTANRVAVVDVADPARPRRLGDVEVCAFPDALAALPDGGVVVSCRFDPDLRVLRGPVEGITGVAPANSFRVERIPAGPEHGHQGLAVDRSGRFAYVGAPALDGIKVVDLAGRLPVRFLATGRMPRRLLLVGGTEGGGPAWLLVDNFIAHTVTVHAITARAEGMPSPARQSIRTHAPVLDLAVVPDDGAIEGDLRGALLLATHEDRTLDRANLAVEGLDSVIMVLPPVATTAGREAGPFADAGMGSRRTLNLCERPGDAVVQPDALAVDPASGRIAVAGAGSDNVLVVPPLARALSDGAAMPSRAVGANPSAVAFLPGDRVVTADRLSDTITIVATGGGVIAPGRVSRGVAPTDAPAPATTQTLEFGRPARTSAADRGEVLFYSRALVPHNVPDGPLSLYTCAACHADGHVDGRRHPAKRNRFYSMTKTCRGLQGTEPFLSLGRPATLAAFADNIVATHAQGALTAPATYDKYDVTLRLRAPGAWQSITLSPGEVRAALAAYLGTIPVEPSPFVAAGQTRLTPSEQRGLAIFAGRCAACHRLATSTTARASLPTGALPAALLDGKVALTSAGLYDVGTPVLGDGGNNPPSLRGAWAAAPYFSDGSAPTLRDVLRRTRPGAAHIHAPDNARLPSAFSPRETEDLLIFLRAL